MEVFFAAGLRSLGAVYSFALQAQFKNPAFRTSRQHAAHCGRAPAHSSAAAFLCHCDCAWPVAAVWRLGRLVAAPALVFARPCRNVFKSRSPTDERGAEQATGEREQHPYRVHPCNRTIGSNGKTGGGNIGLWWRFAPKAAAFCSQQSIPSQFTRSMLLRARNGFPGFPAWHEMVFAFHRNGPSASILPKSVSILIKLMSRIRIAAALMPPSAAQAEATNNPRQHTRRDFQRPAIVCRTAR